MLELFSDVMKSVLYTMGIAAKYKPIHALPEQPGIATEEQNRFAMRLVFEEAILELADGFGFTVYAGDRQISNCDDIRFVQTHEPDFNKIADAAPDAEYVIKRVFAQLGIPDQPHLHEVCRKNDAKFPAGMPAGFDANGKFIKPLDWTPPDHTEVRKATPSINMREVAEQIRVLFSSKET